MLTDFQKDMIRRRKPFDDGQLTAYRTRGGSYMIATPGKWTDSGKTRDLVAISEGTWVIALSQLANPDLLGELNKLFADVAVTR